MAEIKAVRENPHRFNSVAEIKGAIDALVDAWCERRALRPLAAILSTDWPANQLTDGWASLLQALEDVRAGAREQLTPVELETVEDLILAVTKAVYRT